MKVTHFGRAAALLSVTALALTACNGNGGDEENGENGEEVSAEEVEGTLSGGGASSQESAMTEWTQQFMEVAPNAQVDYASVGSGGGRDGLLGGEYDFAGSDAAMDDDEWEDSKEVCGDEGAFHIPSYISPIAVAYNIEGVEDGLQLDADTIAEIFAGEITSWDDEAIAEQNEDADLPSTSITVVHRADDSGTTENFTEYLEAAAPDSWPEEASGDWPSDLSAESAQQTSGVVNLTSETDGAITYADAGQIGELNSVDVRVGGDYVEYSPEAAAQAVEMSPQAEGQAENDMAFDLERDTTEEGTYPIVMVAYNIFCNEYDSQETVDLVKAFGEYTVSEDGQNAAADAAGSAPMSEELRSEAEDAFSQVSAAE
ncbi:MAG: phosphate ABC transporter substrate-binding protein PstS [Nesterenkonia sp.]|uniref:phosphate ABC transporter substrate-binding protein PstS n=1 Tax=Nesterenkonia marinintestina TaxID=2979865 RepID=UPI0021BF7F9C|nr:phosphate ABC transporter substrate-binding protein PstS [Nesterenkonia sp. GX14115]MDO5493261.1 phosphate ABC transporter substrate-binding protein PstS [Nesterenkonia sp.]